ncbi:MAG: hypothetical protein J0H17_10970, partial [Rhizobiales bacterium]|nr:hypothetical protein [Hyphomicrobiales bacterium]
PNSKNTASFDFIEGMEQGDTVFVVYEGRSTSGKVFRNAELFKVRDGKLLSTEVYFGWNVPHPVARGQHGDKSGDGTR